MLVIGYNEQALCGFEVLHKGNAGSVFANTVVDQSVRRCQPFLLLLPLLLCAVVTKDGVYVLDMAAKIDATADYICKAKWGDVEFPPPFGREAYPEVRSTDKNDPFAKKKIYLFIYCTCSCWTLFFNK